jgi:hypothetical protein
MAISGIIPVSGLDTTYQSTLVTSPADLFGSGSEAFLSSINASFGFGSTPHAFNLAYVPTSFDHESLPEIGTEVDFSIDNFLIKGSVTHSDYSKDSKGNLLSITVQDFRSKLSYFFFDTVGLHGRNDIPAENTVDILNWFNTVNVAPATSGRSSAVREMDRIEVDGATYRQIYDATAYYENTVGTVSGLIDAIPLPEVVESQLSGDPDSFRWKISSENALSAIDRIFGDLSYDIYWNMSDGKVSVINRTYSVSIAKENIPYAGDTSETIHLKYGDDEADVPNKLKVFGPEMEGLAGSGRLIPASGAFSEYYDMGVTVGAPVFEAGWKNVVIKYFGPDGELAEDSPTDEELSAALKSIEYWAHEKNLENRISTSGFVPGAGDFVGQVPATEYLATMTSRYSKSKSWVVSWYNKVKSFADSHYGKTYILKNDSSLYSYIDDIEVVNEAWCNLENQSSGNFEDGYKIDSTYNLLSPFYNSNTNKVRAYAVMPSGTKWGVTGKGVPTRFENWNEDANNQFVPINAKMWRLAKSRFESASLEWDNSEKGISVTFPNFCFDPNAPLNSGLLSVSSGILDASNAFETGTWTSDFQDPLLNPIPFSELNPASGQSVSLPIRVSRRYGYSYPSTWASGTGEKLDVRVEDSFAPWSYEPKGLDTSVAKLNKDVNSYLASQKIDTNKATHAEVSKVGLPGISFDDFADQSIGPQGYGSISHGITSLSTSRSSQDNWRTKYSVKAHFPQLIKAKPIQRDREEDFSFVIKQIETKISNLDIDLDINSPQGRYAAIDDSTFTQIGPQAEKRSIPVYIIEVFDTDSGNPYYLSEDGKGIQWPKNLATGNGHPDSRIAHAIDGLLDYDMDCIYNYEQLEDGTFQHWYTGGVDLSDAKIMLVTSDVKVVNVNGQNHAVVDLSTISAPGGTDINITNVPLLDQTNSLAVTKGINVAVASPMGENNIRNYDFTPSGTAGLSSLYVQNPAAAGGGAEFAEVTTAPHPTSGTGGVVATFAVGNLTSTVYSDAEDTQKVTFVGIDPRIVQLGDVGILSIKSDSETVNGEGYFDGSGNYTVPSEEIAVTHILCHIVKPTFINYGLV